jgi:hypothetical protein
MTLGHTAHIHWELEQSFSSCRSLAIRATDGGIRLDIAYCVNRTKHEQSQGWPVSICFGNGKSRLPAAARSGCRPFRSHEMQAKADALHVAVTAQPLLNNPSLIGA